MLSVYIEQELSHGINSYGCYCQELQSPSLSAKSPNTFISLSQNLSYFLCMPLALCQVLCWKSLLSPCLNKVLLPRQEQLQVFNCAAGAGSFQRGNLGCCELPAVGGVPMGTCELSPGAVCVHLSLQNQPSTSRLKTTKPI